MSSTLLHKNMGKKKTNESNTPQYFHRKTSGKVIINNEILNVIFKDSIAEKLRLFLNVWNVNHPFQKDFRNLSSLL